MLYVELPRQWEFWSQALRVKGRSERFSDAFVYSEVRAESLKSSAEILPDAQAQGTWSTIQGLPGRKSPIMSVNQKHPITKDLKKLQNCIKKKCIRKKMYRTSSSWSYLASLNHHEWNVREWNDKIVFCQRNDSKETNKNSRTEKSQFLK